MAATSVTTATGSRVDFGALELEVTSMALGNWNSEAALMALASTSVLEPAKGTCKLGTTAVELSMIHTCSGSLGLGQLRSHLSIQRRHVIVSSMSSKRIVEEIGTQHARLRLVIKVHKLREVELIGRRIGIKLLVKVQTEVQSEWIGHFARLFRRGDSTKEEDLDRRTGRDQGLALEYKQKGWEKGLRSRNWSVCKMRFVKEGESK